MSEILKTNKTFCLAPWIHSFISPQGERKLCCISENVIGTNVTLEEMWNGDEMKDVRKKMLNGEEMDKNSMSNVIFLSEGKNLKVIKNSKEAEEFLREI